MQSGSQRASDARGSSRAAPAGCLSSRRVAAQAGGRAGAGGRHCAGRVPAAAQPHDHPARRGRFPPGLRPQDARRQRALRAPQGALQHHHHDRQPHQEGERLVVPGQGGEQAAQHTDQAQGPADLRRALQPGQHAAPLPDQDHEARQQRQRRPAEQELEQPPAQVLRGVVVLQEAREARRGHARERAHEQPQGRAEQREHRQRSSSGTERIRFAPFPSGARRGPRGHGARVGRGRIGGASPGIGGAGRRQIGRRHLERMFQTASFRHHPPAGPGGIHRDRFAGQPPEAIGRCQGPEVPSGMCGGGPATPDLLRPFV